MESLFKALSGRPIAYYRTYAVITGSVTAGVMLSQIMYWWSAMKENEFYKANEEFADELGLGSKEFKTAKATIKRLGFVEMTLKGTPPRTYYSPQIETIAKALGVEIGPINWTETDQLNGPKGPNQSGQNGPNTNTENTSETTTESVDSLYEIFKEKIYPKSRLTAGSRKKIETRLKSWTFEELKQAIDGFSGSSWWMSHNRRRGVEWFFRSDDQIDRFINLKDEAEGGIRTI